MGGNIIKNQHSFGQRKFSLSPPKLDVADISDPTSVSYIESYQP